MDYLRQVHLHRKGTLHESPKFVRKEVSIAISIELTKLYNPLTDSLRPFSIQSALTLGVNALYPRQFSDRVRRSFRMKKIVLLVAICAGIPALALGQQRPGSLRGQVLDELGGAIVGASVTAIDGKGVEKSVVTNDSGSYTINGLAPGKYTVRAVNAGFAMSETPDVEITAGKPAQFDITLKVAIEEQKVTVSSDAREVSTEPENNAGAVVLKGADIDALPEDPDDLAAALQALAGPSAGPNGGQIFVDGFTGGRLPPRASIREVRINSNPFSAEYDRLGFGRIEILTRPGTDRYRGQVSLNFNDDE